MEKLDKNNQYELNFDSKSQEKIQKTWREKVGEKVFAEKMIDLKIGPGLWDKVKVDDNGNILEVNGVSYEAWDRMQEGSKDKASDMYQAYK